MLFYLTLMLSACMGIFGGTPIQAHSEVKDMVLIQEGLLRLFYPPTPEEKEILVPSFYIDVLPVTNQNFLEFTQANPKWQRDKISRLFADKNYLSHWPQPRPQTLDKLSNRPVTRVSWFAAKAYCQWKGKRLPSENEWEYVASASETKPDGRKDWAWRNRVLNWYAQPNRELENIGQNKPNYWGVHDLHGLVWEWVLDFNSNLLSSDNREAGDKIATRFCGAGALAASEKDDYPSFMRMAFRSSLKASYTTSNLSFRCAKDGDPHE